MKVQPYVFFDGRCEEAIEFYQAKLGAEVTEQMRFSEAPPMPEMDSEGCGGMPPGAENKIMHASIRIGETIIMVSDGMGTGNPKFEGFSLTISVDNAGEAERLFSALAEEGQVQMPLGPSFFATAFGMVADKFGVSWMLIAEK